MAAPTITDLAALVRMIRYLIVRPRCVDRFPWQDEGATLRVYVDADFAGRLLTRRSTCGGVCVRGLRVIKNWPTTQKTIALSSGEAELAGIVKGVAEGLGLTAIAQDF
eukprot:3883517-Alexandrium_andersonii.AAC.1